MAITDEQPTATPAGLAARIERSIRRVRIIGWTLALGWLCLSVALVAYGARQGSLHELETGLRAGEISEVELTSGFLPADARGHEVIHLRWRDGLVLRTATLTRATDERMARNARRDGAPQPIVVGAVRDHLTALDPDVRIVASDHPGPPFGDEASNRIGLARLVLLVCTLGLIAGPRPWRATRWAWAWLVLLAPLVGVPAYFLFGGPTGLFRPKDPRRVRLTGGWAFLLALLLGGASSS